MIEKSELIDRKKEGEDNKLILFAARKKRENIFVNWIN